MADSRALPAALLLCAVGLCACGAVRTPEAIRPQDTRLYTLPAASELAALPGAPDTYRWAGVLDGAAYLIEVPRDRWNGELIMWAHGYRGVVPELKVSPPPIRRHLIERGYAWAASSYSKNAYDVRAGLEDTNALARALVTVAREHGVTLPQPRRLLIAGASMGGHIAATAVERETLADERQRVRYAGALPMCGVLGDTALADYFAAYHLAALQVAGYPASGYPIGEWQAVQARARGVLWTQFPAQPSTSGARFERIAMNLSGGPRPFFAEGFTDPDLQATLWPLGSRDGTLGGVLLASVADTRAIVYRFDTSAGALSAAEQQFNATVTRAVRAAAANPRRADGLRWVPLVSGEFDVPVLTLHTLGDLYVPLRMEQLYRERARAHGREHLLVQRLVRAVGHCAFSATEAEEAFDALSAWVGGAARPAGDDVLAATALAAPEAGCRFTRNDPADAQRLAAQAHYPACPAQAAP